MERQRWKSIALSITPNASGDRVQSSGSQQKMADAIHRYIDMDKEIDQLYRSTDFGSVKAIIDDNILRLEEVFSVNPQMAHREIEAVKQYIYEHYKEELSIDILAKLVYMAPSYLSAIFKKETGQNLSKFIKEYRMEKAKDMLENTHMKIVNVSEAVGYPNVSYFCQSFREFFGVSPQKFRNQGEEVNVTEEV